MNRSLDDFKSRYCTGEFTSLYIAFNDHACMYVKPGHEHFDPMGNFDRDAFPSPEEAQKAWDSNSIWRIQWYPHTPVGSHEVYASTFEGALDHAYAVAEWAERNGQ